MSLLINLFSPLWSLIQTNSRKIIIAAIVITGAYMAIYVTLLSLKKLKVDVFPYYPFDRFFPQSGKWSTLYFLIVIIFLAALAFFLIKGGFTI